MNKKVKIKHMKNNKAHLTAITRKKGSPVCDFLIRNNIQLISIDKDVLDFGCGRGFDADLHLWDKYDPYYFPTYPTKQYDFVICNYVLNVVKNVEATRILNQIKDVLKEDGVAFITVRRDVKTNGFTSRGTFQRNVKLKLPTVKETTGFCIYKMVK